jgi:hypothetical protein
MNQHVWRVLRDYVARTLVLWLLAILAQIIQSVTFWAVGVPRVPLLGVVSARLAYTALAENPRGVLRTLPLTDRDGALIRWWGSFALPTLAVTSCMALAACLCAYKGWVVPNMLWLSTCMVSVVAVLAWLNACEEVLGYPGAGKTRGYVAFVWGALAVAAVVGLPMKELSAPVLTLIAVGGLCLSAVACLPASRRRRVSDSGDPDGADPAQRSIIPRLALKPSGWTVLLLEAGRTSAIISVAALLATTVIHRATAPGLHATVTWLVVSSIAVATSLSMRRWVEAIRSLRILPITGHRLALALYLTMMMPGVLACLVVSMAQHLSPDWGLDIPVYMLVVLLPAPVTLIRWQAAPLYLPQHWAPAMQQALWPTWAGAFFALRGLPFVTTWFLFCLAVIAALFSVIAYRALLAGIRSPAALENHDSAMLESA